MRYKKLGHSGLSVPVFALGCTTLGSQVADDESLAIMNRAFDLGMTFYDVADVYSKGRAEILLGQALKGRRHQAIITTKLFGETGPGPNDKGLSRKHIIEACEASLRRLQTDYIDVYQMHHWDPETPIEESLGAMDDLVRQGKVRYIGASNFMGWQIVEAVQTAQAYGLPRLVSTEEKYSMISRGVEAELLPSAMANKVGVLVFNPIAGGFLTGKYKQNEPPPSGTRFAVRPWYIDNYWNDRAFRLMERLDNGAHGLGVSTVRLAIGWLLANPAVTTVILGATKVSHIEQNLAAATEPLSQQELNLCAAALAE